MITTGMRTSEFYITAVVPLLGGLALIGIAVFGGRPDLLDKGLALMAVGTTAYGISRGVAKIGSGTSEPPPTDAKGAAGVVSKL